jgi:hypothetical protein
LWGRKEFSRGLALIGKIMVKEYSYFSERFVEGHRRSEELSWGAHKSGEVGDGGRLKRTGHIQVEAGGLRLTNYRILPW